MTSSSTSPVNPWREAMFDRLAVLCMDVPQDEPPSSILRRIIAAEVKIALDPSVSDAAPAAPVPAGWVMAPREPTPEMLAVVRNGPMHETWTEGYCAMIAASPAAPVPLTDEQIDKILERERMKWATSPPTYEFAASFARAIEAAHGITGASK